MISVEPNQIGDEACIVVDVDGYWYDVPCNDRHNFLCLHDDTNFTSSNDTNLIWWHKPMSVRWHKKFEVLEYQNQKCLVKNCEKIRFLDPKHLNSGDLFVIWALPYICVIFIKVMCVVEYSNWIVRMGRFFTEGELTRV